MEDKLKEVFCKHLGVQTSVLSSDFDLFGLGGMDSLDTFEVILEIEELFDIEITDRELQLVRTFGDLETLVKGKI